MSPRAAPPLPLLLVVSVLVPFTALGSLALSACGGPAKGGEVAPVPSLAKDGGAAGAGAGAAPTPLPSGLPPFAPMPEPGVKGSSKVTLKVADACAAPASGAKVSALLACDKGQKAMGAPFEGTAGEGDPAASTTFRAEKGRCYRVYSTSDAGSLVVVLTDSAGARIAESPGAATPERALACFTASDTVTVSVAAGRGKGRFAVQVSSD